MMPDWIETWVRDGGITSIAVVFLAVEALVLLLAGRRTVLPVLANGLSGLFLLLAVHAALVGIGLAAVAICLALGGLFHLADLVMRLRR